MTAEDRLLATCWTSAGDAASDRPDLRSPLRLRQRIEAASAAGYTGFGLLSADLPAAEHWAAKLAELAAQAEGVGTRLGLEFFPWSNIKDLYAGLRLVDDAGHDASASSSTCGTSSAPTPRSATSRPSR